MNSENSYYATGKRKSAIARTWLMPGKGDITVNNRPADEYFTRLPRKWRQLEVCDRPHQVAPALSRHLILSHLHRRHRHWLVFGCRRMS